MRVTKTNALVFCAVGLVGIACGSLLCQELQHTSGKSWLPPIGIPEPPFGIREVAPPSPSHWSAAIPSFIYVNAESPAATDLQNPYGSPAHPRRTIPGKLPAGTVVEVHGRYTFDHTGRNRVLAVGTQSNPVYIRGAGAAGQRAVMTKGLVLYGSYAIVENILFDHSGTTAAGTGVGIGLPDDDSRAPAECTRERRPACADHIVFRHNELMGATGPGAFRNCGGLNVGGWTDNLPAGSNQSFIVFWDNNIHDEGQMNPLTDKDQPCTVLNVGRYAHHVWILDNKCTNVAQSCVQIVPTTNGSAYEDTHHIYVGRNISDRASKNAFWVKAASDVIFSENVAHDTVEKSYNPSTGFGLQYGPQRVWFLYNEAYNVTGGIWLAGDSDGGPDQRYFLVGNYIHDITNAGRYFTTWEPHKPWSSAGIFDASGAELHIVGNVLWGFKEANGINKPSSGGGLEIANNFIGSFADRNSWALFFENSRDFQRATVDYNQFMPRVWDGEGGHTSAKSLQGQGKCRHCNEAGVAARQQTAFKSAAAANQLLDQEFESAVYDSFFKLYGIDIRPSRREVQATMGVKR
jgi:hypothetical protein